MTICACINIDSYVIRLLVLSCIVERILGMFAVEEFQIERLRKKTPIACFVESTKHVMLNA